MSTKTMRLPPRRVLTPSNKRKEEEDNNGADAVQVQPSTTKKPKPAQPLAEQGKEAASAPSSNQLLAGCLAHEFLTKGTLFGQPFDAPRAERSASGWSEELKLRREVGETEEGEGAEPSAEGLNRYVAVADLLGSDGAQLVGVFNPTQLARILQL